MLPHQYNCSLISSIDHDKINKKYRDMEFDKLKQLSSILNDTIDAITNYDLTSSPVTDYNIQMYRTMIGMNIPESYGNVAVGDHIVVLNQLMNKMSLSIPLLPYDELREAKRLLDCVMTSDYSCMIIRIVCKVKRGSIDQIIANYKKRCIEVLGEVRLVLTPILRS